MVRALKIDETFGMNRPLTRVYKIAPCFLLQVEVPSVGGPVVLFWASMRSNKLQLLILQQLQRGRVHRLLILSM